MTLLLVDSNTWIFGLDTGVPEHDVVRPRLETMLEDEDVVIPTIVQMEVLHYLARQVDDPEPIAERFLSYPAEVDPLTGATVREAAKVLMAQRDVGLGGRDAAILVLARRRGARLVTADQVLQRVADAVGVEWVDVTS